MQRPGRTKRHSVMDNRANTLDVEHDSDQESHFDDNIGPAEISPRVTSFSVKDILDPNKFTTSSLRRRSSESECDSDSELRGNGQATVWHPWMSATRYNRANHSSHGEFDNFSCRLVTTD